MDVVHPRCAGIDISKTDAKVCVRILVATYATVGVIPGRLAQC